MIWNGAVICSDLVDHYFASIFLVLMEFILLVQLSVFGAPLPPKVAQPVAERPAVSSAPAPAVAAPTQDNQEDAAPSEMTEG